MHPFLGRTALAVTLLTDLARVGQAQTRVEVGPMVAAFLPVGSYRHDASYWQVGTPDNPRDNRGIAWGGEARVWFGPRFGLGLIGAMRSASQGPVAVPSGAVVATESRIFALTAQMLYDLTPSSSAANVWMSAGGGVIHYGGSAYQSFGTPSQATAALGAGSSLRLVGALRATVGANALIYDFDLPSDPHVLGGNGHYLHGVQTDVLLHAGLSVRVR